jgi:hypothetical protein
MTVLSAFPGHAGRVRPLLRWRSVARIQPTSIPEDQTWH